MFTPLMNGLDTIDMTVSIQPTVSPPTRLETDVRGDLHTSHAQREKYIKNILPIGVLFSGSLILSNMAYLT